MDDLQPLDEEYVQLALSAPPFVSISGVINVRDLGSYPTSYTNKMTRPGFMFRSAELSSITEQGKKDLEALGITKVFDLRSDTEIEKYGSHPPHIEGVDIQRVPVFAKEDYSPEMMASRFSLYASGKTESFMELYSQILEHGGPSFGAILRHIRDKPSERFLFHCTAGKDRTGIIAAIILKLAGVDNEKIAKDYALTRVGREPARAKIMARLSKEPLFASDNEAALNMFSCRHETMIAFLALFEVKYGGVEEYVVRFTNLDRDSICTIRENILVPSHALMQYSRAVDGKVTQVAVHQTVEVVVEDIESERFQASGYKLMICSQKPSSSTMPPT